MIHHGNITVNLVSHWTNALVDSPWPPAEKEATCYANQLAKFPVVKVPGR